MIAVCIPTYQRPELLEHLLGDLQNQELRPGRVIVVDGGGGGDVLRRLEQRAAAPFPIEYVPSNHANLPYQRFLGWKIAMGADLLVYVDDDLRLPGDLLSRINRAFALDPRIVGVTAEIRQTGYGGSVSGAGEHPVAPSALSGWFGGARRLSPGGLSPVGQRRPPDPDSQDIAVVEWLRGGVMAFRRASLEGCFSTTLFAMYERRVGKAEDTHLSRAVGLRGSLVSLRGEPVIHGCEEPVAYPASAFRRSRAVAYSRRLLNDDFRGAAGPKLGDRLALLRTYFGNILIRSWTLLKRPGAATLAGLAGYAWGAILGCFCRPSAVRLTPSTQWWADADEAVRSSSTISGSETGA